MKKKQQLLIQLDSSEMDETQKRLIKYLNSMVLHLLTTDDEGEFFEGSTEAMRMLAGIIKKSNFSKQMKEKSNIDYDEQALEFSLETLAEDMYQSKSFVFDN